MIPWTIRFHDRVIALEIVGPDSIAVDQAELSPDLLATESTRRKSRRM